MLQVMLQALQDVLQVPDTNGTEGRDPGWQWRRVFRCLVARCVCTKVHVWCLKQAECCFDSIPKIMQVGTEKACVCERQSKRK